MPLRILSLLLFFIFVSKVITQDEDELFNINHNKDDPEPDTPRDDTKTVDTVEPDAPKEDINSDPDTVGNDSQHSQQQGRKAQDEDNYKQTKTSVSTNEEEEGGNGAAVIVTIVFLILLLSALINQVIIPKVNNKLLNLNSRIKISQCFLVFSRKREGKQNG